MPETVARHCSSVTKPQLRPPPPLPPLYCAHHGYGSAWPADGVNTVSAASAVRANRTEHNLRIEHLPVLRSRAKRLIRVNRCDVCAPAWRAAQWGRCRTGCVHKNRPFRGPFPCIARGSRSRNFGRRRPHRRYIARTRDIRSPRRPGHTVFTHPLKPQARELS